MSKRAFLIGLAAVAILHAGTAGAQDADVATQVVDAMNKLFGVHPGFRAFHAKGVVVEGTFRGSPEARALSKASLFAGTAIPVTVRFSDNTGLPTIPDGSPDANPHGMALKFHLPDGSETDMVTNSLKVFPVSTAADLRDLFEAVAASPPNAAKPTKLDSFLADHPTVGQALATTATPSSLANEEYRGLNAFILVDKDGKRQAVRYVIAPDRVVHLDPKDAAARAADYLMSELPERLKGGPVTFHLKAQLAAPGDPTNDPSKAWPEDRRLVDLGTIAIDKAVADSAGTEKQLLYLPGQITDGIELSDDPMVLVRNEAYAVSFARRVP